MSLGMTVIWRLGSETDHGVPESARLGSCRNVACRNGGNGGAQTAADLRREYGHPVRGEVLDVSNLPQIDRF